MEDIYWYLPRPSFACPICCSDDGQACITPLPCNESLSLLAYNNAKEKCTEIGKRLCKREEIRNDVCCDALKDAIGDIYPVWTSEQGYRSNIALVITLFLLAFLRISVPYCIHC